MEEKSKKGRAYILFNYLCFILLQGCALRPKRDENGTKHGDFNNL